MTHREILVDSADQTPEPPAPSSANGTRPKSAGAEVVATVRSDWIISAERAVALVIQDSISASSDSALGAG